ncbi:hypothetical protein [Pseudorhodoferax sp.]|uniref:hypothetical protein n=1 Tax=Pseudorhodoferax sp. TaxID=1993553 RepID=UPI002DD6AF0F|nr:hypothetical protein [Pseudorhodoferax sp.]
MLAAEELSIRPVGGAQGQGGPRSELVWHGRPVARHVDGCVLEAAIAGAGFYLLFTTDDIPYEESLTITLLDGDLGTLDTAVLCGLYSTGSFALVGQDGERTVRFRFFGDTDWSVEVLAQPRARLPFVPEVAGVSRPFGFSRHFIVRGDPKPAAPGDGA